VATKANAPSADVSAAAEQIWKDLAPKLERLSDFDRLHGDMLARFDAVEALIRSRSGAVPPETLAGHPNDDRGTTGKSGQPKGIRIYFVSGSADLSFDQRDKLRLTAQILRQAGAAAIITGYADRRGSVTRNNTLSLARARHVASVLEEFGAHVKSI